MTTNTWRRLAALAGRALVTLAVAGSGIAGSALTNTARADVSPLTPWPGVLVGASASTSDFRTLTGREPDLHRVYDNWDDAQPDPTVKLDLAQGITPIISIRAGRKNGTVVDMAGIAAGTYDADIRRQAAGIAGLGARVFLTFDHEPEDDSQGPAFVAAWRHYVDVFRASGVTNVSWTWIMMGWSFSKYSNFQGYAYYPGDDYVDWMAVDAYNWYNCRSPKPVWRDLSAIVADWYNWALPHNKPLMLAEFGTVEDPAMPGRKAQWFATAQAQLKGMPAIKAVAYFNSTRDCQWVLDSSGSAQAAFATLTMDPYFNLRPAATLTAPAVVPGGSPVTFATSTGDTGGAVASWSLDFGDGSALVSGSGVPPATFQHTYPAAGTRGQVRTAVLRITDSRGLSDAGFAAVTVVPGPAAVTGGVTAVTAQTAQVSGKVNPNQLDTAYWVEYGTGTAYGASTSPVPLPAGNTAVPVSVGLSGLAQRTAYHFRLVARNAAGTSYGADRTLRTYGVPAVTTGSVAALAPGSATVRGSVSPNGLATTYQVEYGTTTSYGSATARVAAPSATRGVRATLALTGLRAATAYHYRWVAVNAAGTTYGVDRTLISAGPPQVATRPASGLGTTGAVLNGWVDANSLPTTRYFQWGTTSAYGASSAISPAGQAAWGVTVPGLAISGLSSRTTYHFRIVAVNALGTVVGPDRTFSTR